MKYVFLLVLFIVAGCSSSSGNKPSMSKKTSSSVPVYAFDNLCKILDYRPDWRKTLISVKAKYGVPPHVIMSMMHQESKFVSDARPIAQNGKGMFGKRYASSAFGYAQVLDGTWQHYLDANGISSARRDNFHDAAHFMGWYIQLANKSLSLSKWDARYQYLAYHEGHGGYKRKTYHSKPWLVKVSEKVGARSSLYASQYKRCSSNSRASFLERYIL